MKCATLKWITSPSTYLISPNKNQQLVATSNPIIRGPLLNADKKNYSIFSQLSTYKAHSSPIILKRHTHNKVAKKSVRLTIIGAPGSGKGTQSTKIEQDFGLSTISTGQILRRLADESSERGASVSAILKAGGLVGDDIMLEIIKKAILQETNGWLLDGYPRNPKQAAQLDELLHGVAQPLSLVFYLNVPEEVLRERVQERWVHPASGRTYNMTFSPPKLAGIDDVTGEPLVRRTDDNEEALQARIRTYHAATLPLIEYYRSAGILVPVDSPTSHVGYIKIKQVLQELIQS